jgi:DNA-binding NtrC family response regulator
MSKILIADDERTICEAFARLIEKEGHQPLIASTGKQALTIIREERPDAVFMDVRMPGMDGLETLSQIQQENGDIPVVIMTAYGTMETALEAIRKGAFDYLGKPVELDKLRLLLTRMLAYSSAKAVQTQALQTSPQANANMLVGRSAPMQELFKLMGLLTTNDMTALITGESGVGKELVARGIHLHGRNSHEPFVAINCAAIPETLMESELFGHEKGAFTGAKERRIGRFESAGNGTLFLDEIGELSLPLQSKLLRVLQERSFERIGGNSAISLQSRIIAASNRNLETEVAEKRFREDLYHRLNVITLCVPPLRQRKEDIPLLAQHFSEQAGLELNKPLRGLESDAIQLLVSYAWPGNVRELEHVIKRSALLARGDILTIHDLKMSLQPDEKSTPNTGQDRFANLAAAIRDAFHEASEQASQHNGDDSVFHRLINYAESELIAEALRVSDGNQVLAAKKLGLHRNTLRNKLPKDDR